MLSIMPRPSSPHQRAFDAPLLVTLAAALLGGLGNVAFSAHAGSPLALAALRFACGLLFSLLWLRLAVPAARRPGPRRSPMRLLAAAAGGASPLLLMLTSEHLDTALFTLISGTTPLFVFLLSRRFALPPVPAGRLLLAAVAVLLALASAVAGELPLRPVALPVVGLVLAFSGTFALALALLAVSRLGMVHPARLLADLCAAGLLISLLLAPFLPFRASSSTVVVAALIALLPGGLAKVALMWSAARTSPLLVSASLSVAVVSAAAAGWLLLGERLSGLSVLFALLTLLTLARLTLLPPVSAGRRAG